MANNPLETRWGGGNPMHPPIIISPSNSQSDLVLVSEVLVQTFFSTSRHEYHYKAQNNSHATGVNCSIRVEWQGPKINWAAVPPGRTTATKILSFFSPQLLRTTADADVLTGISSVAVSARNVAAERADAYVPWTSNIPGGVKEIYSIIKGILSLGETVKAYAVIALGNEEAIRIESSVRSAGQRFAYQCSVQNKLNSLITGHVEGLLNPQKTQNFELNSGVVQLWDIESNSIPGESIGIFAYKLFGPENSEYNTLQIPLLGPIEGQ